jgi:hypothetical protein
MIYTVNHDQKCSKSAQNLAYCHIKDEYSTTINNSTPFNVLIL